MREGSWVLSTRTRLGSSVYLAGTNPTSRTCQFQSKSWNKSLRIKVYKVGSAAIIKVESWMWATFPGSRCSSIWAVCLAANSLVVKSLRLTGHSQPKRHKNYFKGSFRTSQPRISGPRIVRRRRSWLKEARGRMASKYRRYQLKN